MPELSSLSQKIFGFFVKEPLPAGGAPIGVSAAPGTPLPGHPVAGPPAAGTRAGSGPAASGPAAGVPGRPGEPGALDARFAEHFAQLLAKNNPPGPDYFEFQEALRGLADLGLPEAQRYQAAWATFKAMGGPSDRAALVHTAQQCMNVLRADRAAFQQSAATAATERVGALQAEQQRLRADNEALTRQLSELQARLTANADRLRVLDGETTEQATRLDERRRAYDVTFAHFTQQLETDIARISQYLGG